MFDLHPLALPEPTQLALRRACIRRHGAVLDANRVLRRLISLARWAFPDLWSAFAGSRPTALACSVSAHLQALATARRPALTAVVAEHTRAMADVPARVEQVRAPAGAWAGFWDGHLDLDALAEDVTDLLTDAAAADQRVARASARATGYWERLYGDDPLLGSVPGLGPVISPTVRAFLGDGTGFDTAQAAARYVGITPSNWSSGTMAQPSGRSPRKGRPRCGWRFTSATAVAPERVGSPPRSGP